MSKVLDEYRDKLIKEQDDLFEYGFDAAIALNLPVLFAEWKELYITYYKGLFRNANNKNEPLKMINGDLVHTNTELYHYWLDNVFKIT